MLLENFVKTFRNIFIVPDLRKRLLYTLAMLVVYRAGSVILTPGIDRVVLDRVWRDVASNLLGVLDLFTGGNLRVVSIFALGVTPYITASIIMQLMTVVSERVKQIQQEGELGRRKINQYTRYLTVLLCLIQSTGIAYWLTQQPDLVTGMSARVFIPLAALTWTTGTIFIMWIGEQITERGVGNGISLIIFAGIVIGLPEALRQIWERIERADPLTTLGILLMLVAGVLIVAAVVFVERGQRKIPISYARRVVGQRVLGGQMTHLPLRVNMGGVIPVIFAVSVLSFPQTIAQFTDWAWLQRHVQNFNRAGHPFYDLVFVIAIIFFSFFYVSIIFNTDEVAENLRKHGGFIPGIRPGKRTSEYLNEILTRLTAVGSLYLAIICLIPQFILTGFKVQEIPWIGPWLSNVLANTPGLSWIQDGLGFQFYFGGTSLLIVVGVAMDTIAQIESQLIMRHYDGFLGPKGRRLRGRRIG
ncbi:MAG: preprotein translocase subunit SecY [Blastocatellia bacterium]|nr:preprotein translocase subunit SecY [Blastocatellia bacterium]MCX7752696.1 preprotein translocase subunit SecY [Blastocatellia bacterium]MDW8255623.1 preprotein translocase subunit SecY [Acidobacteriota bacterium]